MATENEEWQSWLTMVEPTCNRSDTVTPTLQGLCELLPEDGNKSTGAKC